jgi:enterochelin esterase-like enzyme
VIGSSRYDDHPIKLVCLFLILSSLILALTTCSPGINLTKGVAPTVDIESHPATSSPDVAGIEIKPTDNGIQTQPAVYSTEVMSMKAIPPTESPIHPTQIASTETRSTVTPTPTCWNDGGKIEKGELTIPMLRQPLEFRVYLPPCYEQQPDQHYPVLYLIHGQSYTDDQWERLGAGITADDLIANGDIPPLIIVMPRDRIWEQPNVDKFGDAVVQALIPYIDQTYRTLPKREFRAVGGLSRGAGWAIHLGLSHWELFGAIGAHSLPVFWNDTAHITTWLDSIPFQALPRIYIDIGDKDRPPILGSAIWFEQLLTRKGIPHEWHLYSGYHEEAYWRAHVEQYLLWYSLGWQTDITTP